MGAPECFGDRGYPILDGADRIKEYPEMKKEACAGRYQKCRKKSCSRRL